MEDELVLAWQRFREFFQWLDSMEIELCKYNRQAYRHLALFIPVGVTGLQKIFCEWYGVSMGTLKKSLRENADPPGRDRLHTGATGNKGSRPALTYGYMAYETMGTTTHNEWGERKERPRRSDTATQKQRIAGETLSRIREMGLEFFTVEVFREAARDLGYALTYAYALRLIQEHCPGVEPLFLYANKRIWRIRS